MTIGESEVAHGRDDMEDDINQSKAQHQRELDELGVLVGVNNIR